MDLYDVMINNDIGELKKICNKLGRKNIQEILVNDIRFFEDGIIKILKRDNYDFIKYLTRNEEFEVLFWNEINEKNNSKFSLELNESYIMRHAVIYCKKRTIKLLFNHYKNYIYKYNKIKKLEVYSRAIGTCILLSENYLNIVRYLKKNYKNTYT